MTQRERSLKCDAKNSTSINISRYYPSGNRYGFSISVQPEIIPLFPLFSMLKKMFFKSSQVCDWLAKWLIMLGFMDRRRLRVVWHSNIGLVEIWHFGKLLCVPCGQFLVAMVCLVLDIDDIYCRGWQNILVLNTDISTQGGNWNKANLM